MCIICVYNANYSMYNMHNVLQIQCNHASVFAALTRATYKNKGKMHARASMKQTRQLLSLLVSWLQLQLLSLLVLWLRLQLFSAVATLPLAPVQVPLGSTFVLDTVCVQERSLACYTLGKCRLFAPLLAAETCASTEWCVKLAWSQQQPGHEAQGLMPMGPGMGK